MRGFFGGDPTKSHFTAQIKGLHNRMPREERRERREKLKAAGYRERYFQFTNKDEAGMERARKLAEAEAARWQKATGVEMEVVEGCFL